MSISRGALSAHAGAECGHRGIYGAPNSGNILSATLDEQGHILTYTPRWAVTPGFLREKSDIGEPVHYLQYGPFWWQIELFRATVAGCQSTA